MSPQLKKGIRWAISAAILVFLIVFARTIDWHAAWSSMRHASLPLLAAAIGVNILSVLIKGVRWWLFLRPIGITSLPLAIRATIAGAGLNNVLVASGGDAARVVFVSRVSGVPSSTVLASMALELAAAAAHVNLPLAGSLACLLGINVGLIIRATPGNVGFFQFVFALMAEQFGVSRDDAIAVSLLIQTLQILPLTLLGIALAPEFIFRRGKKDKETEAVAKKIEQEKLEHHGPLSTAEEVLKRADQAGVAPAPKKS